MRIYLGHNGRPVRLTSSKKRWTAFMIITLLWIGFTFWHGYQQGSNSHHYSHCGCYHQGK